MVKGKHPFQTITLKLSDIQIKQALHKYKHTYKMIYEEAYPISVGTQGLNGSDSDFMRLNVIFAYTKWKRDTLSTPEIYKLVDFAGGIGKDNLVLPSAALDGKNTVLPI